jgi:hypothetical protein
MKTSIADALARLPASAHRAVPEGAPSVTVLAHGSMQLKVFNPALNPAGATASSRMTRTSSTWCTAGSATMVIGAQQWPARAGDAFFVAAGASTASTT